VPRSKFAAKLVSGLVNSVVNQDTGRGIDNRFSL
jgi:hypothetical protein